MHLILIVEDEPAIRAVLRVLLEAQGYRCAEADTAMRAEIEARSHKPDLLLIDLGLPDADGLKVIRRVRAWSQVPIVVLSARTMEEQKIAALATLLHFGPLRIDLARREARGVDGEVHLTPLEYRVLACLARHLGSILMQRQLIREVWGPERQDDSRSLRVCIKNLRAKL